MKMTIHENNWTILIEDDIRNLTKDEILDVARMLSKQTVVVFPNQKCKVDNYANLHISIFGELNEIGKI